jgi:aryl-alcohol dehydrogenase-like predicted oxidoreductase
LQNTRFLDETIPLLLEQGVGIMNAGPFSARLLTNSTLPAWFRDPVEVQEVAKKAAAHCTAKGVDIAQLALQFCLMNEQITTNVAGSANPNNIRKWVAWASEPIDLELLAEVQQIFAPVKNVGHQEGLPENNFDTSR